MSTRSLSLLGAAMLVSIAAPASAEPPFLAGEVAVYAEPAELGDYHVKRYLPYSGISVLAVGSGAEWGQVQQLRERGFHAGVNLQASKVVATNDPVSSYQWHFDNIQMDQAWGVSTGSGVTVAVLDSGLAYGGPDGLGCVIPGTDVVNGDADPADGDGHGTHVSGTIAQATNNGTGVAGVAHDACVMPVKVLDDSGSGGFADIAEGIYYAVDNGAQVINMSLGIPARYRIESDPIMDPALDYAYANDVTVVAAAGNDGSRRNVSYPASYSTTLAVGATDALDNLAPYSNRGKGLDLVAPGGNTSADTDGDGYVDGVLQETLIDGSWGYYFFQGTSMAAPHVAGVAALLIANGTATTPDAIKAVLQSTAKDLGDPGFDSTYGAGLIQAYAALSGSEPPPPPPPEGPVDADGDGFSTEDGDCDDSDASVYPGANDTKGKWGRDGIDNDCNGVIDG
jgi:serine protease